MVGRYFVLPPGRFTSTLTSLRAGFVETNLHRVLGLSGPALSKTCSLPVVYGLLTKVWIEVGTFGTYGETVVESLFRFTTKVPGTLGVKETREDSSRTVNDVRRLPSSRCSPCPLP